MNFGSLEQISVQRGVVNPFSFLKECPLNLHLLPSERSNFPTFLSRYTFTSKSDIQSCYLFNIPLTQIVQPATEHFKRNCALADRPFGASYTNPTTRSHNSL
jgi:hypothetical protein